MKLKALKLITILLAALLLLVIPVSPVMAADPVQIVLGGSGATPWAIGPIAPGNSGTKVITIRNSGTVQGDLTLWLSNIVNTEGTPAEFESVPGTTGELGNFLTLSVTSARLSSNIAMPALLGSLPQSSSDANYIKVNALTSGETVTLTWQWTLPGATGNIVQGDSLSFTLNYLLEDFSTTPPPTTTTPPPTTTTPWWPPSWWPWPPATTTPPVTTTTMTPTMTTTTTTTTTTTATTSTTTVVTTTSATTTSPATTTTTPGTTTTTAVTTTTTPGTGGYTLEIDLLGQVTRVNIRPDNTVQQNYTVRSPDGKIEFILSAGTRITTDNNVPLARIVIRSVPLPAFAEDGKALIQAYEILAYDINGNLTHVSFEPPIMLKLKYDPNDLPDDTTEVYIVHYEEVSGTWTRLDPPPGYMPVDGEVAAMISHFSLYGVLAKISSSNVEPVTTACYSWVVYTLLGLAASIIFFLIFLRRRRRKYE